MARLWFFNPWNDLALGANATHYTPPPAALRLEKAGQTLPLWMAAPTDYVLLDDAGRDFRQARSSRFNLPRPWRGEPIDRCEPWGWSMAARRRFLDAGVPPSLLPSDDCLDTLRRLSHRRLTIEAHRFLATGLDPVEAFDTARCERELESRGSVMAKYPWSSTGRGVFRGTPELKTSFLTRCGGAIAHQGSVMIERAFDVDTDFAMLYRTDGHGGVEFLDYSLMENRGAAYRGHVILPAAESRRLLAAKVGHDVLDNARDGMAEFLERHVAGHYDGCLGVDMFVYRDARGSLCLNPCVEINLRHTMGTLVWLLRRNHIGAGFRGRLVTESRGEELLLTLGSWPVSVTAGGV